MNFKKMFFSAFPEIYKLKETELKQTEEGTFLTFRYKIDTNNTTYVLTVIYNENSAEKYQVRTTNVPKDTTFKAPCQCLITLLNMIITSKILENEH